MGGVSGKTKEAPEPGLVGIHNFQNTCYMNASLQCLAHTTLLAHHFLLYHRDRRLLDNPPISSTANLASPCPSPAQLVPGQDMTALVAGASSSKGRFTKSPSPPLSEDVDKPLCVGELSDEFARVIYTIWNGKTASFKPRKFKELIDRVDTRFKGVKDQHDAFEFLLEVLIAKLHQDLVAVNRMRSISPSHRLSPDIPLDSVDPLLWQVPFAYSHSMLPASVPSIKRSLTNSSSMTSLSYHSRSPSLEPPHMPHPGLDGGSSQPGGPPNDADYKSRQKRTARVRLFINRNELHRRDKDWKLTFRQLAVNTWQQRMNEKGRSIFTDHFHGQYKKMVFCSQCDHVAISFPLFLYIDLPLHINEKHPIALADLLARHESSEILEDWKCDWCTKKNGQKVQGRLVLSLWKLPDILMLRLGRVHRRPGQEDDKINHAISFPLHGLNCSPYLCTDSPYAPHHRSATTPQSMRAPFSPLSSSSTDSTVQSPSFPFSPGSGLERLYNETDEDWVSRMSLSYDLYAVLHHQGDTPKHGHYVAEVLNHFDGKFYSFNDKKIEQLKSFDSNEYVSQQAYILFYQSRYSVAIHERQVQSWSELLGANSSSPLPLPSSHQQLSASSRNSPPPDALHVSPSLPLPLPLPSNPPARDSLKPTTPSPEICAQVSAMRIDPRPMDPPRADTRSLPYGPPSQSPMSTNQPQRITARSHATLTEVSVLQHLLPFHPNQQHQASHPLATNPNPRPLPANPGGTITGVRPSSAVSPPPVLVQEVGRHGPVTIDERIRKPRPKTPRLCRGC